MWFRILFQQFRKHTDSILDIVVFGKAHLAHTSSKRFGTQRNFFRIKTREDMMVAMMSQPTDVTWPLLPRKCRRCCQETKY